MQLWKHRKLRQVSTQVPSDSISAELLLLLLLCPAILGIRGGGLNASVPAVAPLSSHNYSPESLYPASAPGPVVPFLPASPIYPFLPSGPVMEPTTGLCNINFSVISQTLQRTAGDCTALVATLVGNVICCPQFESMLRILEGQLSHITGSLVLNNTEAEHCLAETMGFLTDNGVNSTITTKLCNVKPANLTGGSCPVSTVKDFEQLVNTSKLLSACSSVDRLKECCISICEPAIMDAAVRLASRDNTPLVADGKLGNASPQQVLNDCQGVVLSWLARQLGPDGSNSAFRIFFGCEVNKVCPLAFHDTSDVAKACAGNSPSKSTCCNSLYAYISEMQQQMLITNVQALECVTLFGSMLQKRGVSANVYNLCQVDLKDFSLQVHGEEGCLLRAIPTDVVYDNASGISFICDLNDNIPAPWPASSSLSSFPLCATRDTLPALPVLDASGSWKTQQLDFPLLFVISQYVLIILQNLL